MTFLQLFPLSNPLRSRVYKIAASSDDMENKNANNLKLETISVRLIFIYFPIGFTFLHNKYIKENV